MDFKVMCFGTFETGQTTFFFFLAVQTELFEGILNLLLLLFQKSHFLPLFLKFLHDDLKAVMFSNLVTASWFVREGGELTTFVA